MKKQSDFNKPDLSSDLDPDNTDSIINQDEESTTTEVESTPNWILPLILVAVLSIGAYFMTQASNRAIKAPTDIEIHK